MGKNFQKIYPGPFIGTFYSGADCRLSGNLKLEKLDIGKKEEVVNLLKKYPVDTVILASALIHAKNKNDFYSVNVLGAKNVVEAMRECGIKRIIYISTAVLESEETLWGEYGRTKHLAEEIIKSSGLDYIILRPAQIYGEHEQEGMGKLIRLIKKYPFFPLIGGGNNMLSPVRAEDVCRIIVKCLEEVKYNNKIYTLCGGEKINFRDLVLRIARQFDKKIYFIPIPKIFLKIAHFLPFLNADQILRAANTRAFDCSVVEAEFDYKFRGMDFSYL